MWQVVGYFAIAGFGLVVVGGSWWWYRGHPLRRISPLRRRQLDRIVADQQVRW